MLFLLKWQILLDGKFQCCFERNNTDNCIDKSTRSFLCHACDNMGPHSFLICPFVSSSVCFSISRNITDNWQVYTIFLYVTHTIMSEHKVFCFVHLFVCLSIPIYTNYRMTLNETFIEQKLKSMVQLLAGGLIIKLLKSNWNIVESGIKHHNPISNCKIKNNNKCVVSELCPFLQSNLY